MKILTIAWPECHVKQNHQNGKWNGWQEDYSFTVFIIPKSRTNKSESICAVKNPLNGFVASFGEATLLHKSPHIGELVWDRIVPHSQLGPILRTHWLIQRHIFPNAEHACKGEFQNENSWLRVGLGGGLNLSRQLSVFIDQSVYCLFGLGTYCDKKIASSY